MIPALDRLLREAAAALPRDATCDEIALWILSRRANALRLILAGMARVVLRRYDDEPAWLRSARLEGQR